MCCVYHLLINPVQKQTNACLHLYVGRLTGLPYIGLFHMLYVERKWSFMNEGNQSNIGHWIASQSNYANSLSNEGPAFLYRPIEF